MHGLVLSDQRLKQIEQMGFGVSMNSTLKQRITAGLIEKRDIKINKQQKAFREQPKFTTRREVAILPVAMLSFVGAFFSVVVMAIALIVAFILYIVGSDLSRTLSVFGWAFLACLVFSLVSFAATKLYNRIWDKHFAPLKQAIMDECESDISRLDSDPAFLIRCSREYCKDQIEICEADLANMDKEFTDTIKNPLDADKASLNKWQNSVTTLENWEISEFPSKEFVLADAKQKVAHYQELVNQTEPLLARHRDKEQLVRTMISEFNLGIVVLEKMERDFTTIDTVLADLERENTQIGYREEVMEQRRQAATKLGGMLEEKYNLLVSIQGGLIDMAQDLPQPDNFSLKSRPIPELKAA